MTEPPVNPDAAETYAAVDLGSNSFHMIIGKLDNEQLVIFDRLRDAVRLGGGLLPDKTITDEARDRALESLSRMGQRLRGLPHHAVSAVGTNTMRQIRDGGAFLRAAEEALGHPIEIIAGREEARLVYLGVAHGLAADEDTRLVVDIGGGSTELILGSGLEAGERESLFMGCVSMTGRFFASGRIKPEDMEQAVMAGRLELRPVQADVQHQPLAVRGRQLRDHQGDPSVPCPVVVAVEVVLGRKNRSLLKIFLLIRNQDLAGKEKVTQNYNHSLCEFM